MYYTKAEVERRAAAERKRIGGQIAEARKDAGLTQVKLSGMTGISRSDISRIENGTRNASIDVLTSIAHVLNCDVWMLRRDMCDDGKANYDQEYVSHIIKNGNVLTMGEFRRLRGKRIAYTFRGYHENEGYVEEAVLGEDVIIRDIEGYRRTYFITSEDGKNMNLFTSSMDDDAVLNCTDWGREVYFIEL